MAFLDKNGLQTLTNKLVQGDAIKVASHRGHTVTNVIDNIQRECENISTPNIMNLENRINEFKVGKGRDVDVSGDVEEGKIEVELQGKTWQNLVKNYWTMGKVEVDDKYITASPSYGQYIGMGGGFVYNLKQGVQYTFIVNVIENTLEDSFEFALIQDGNWKNGLTIKSGQTGTIVRKITANADAISGYKIQTSNKNHSGTLKFEKNFLLLEGDYTQTPVEELPKYFEGIKSSFEDRVVDVEVRGKNLFDGSYRFGYLQGGDTPLYIDRDSGATRSAVLKVKPNTTYNISKEYSIRNTIGLFKDYPINNTPYTPIPLNINGTRVNTGDNNYMVVYVSNESEEPWLQVEEGFVATPYEPYYKKKISFNIGEPLRSLPNGVCDEIRNSNGQWELVRRVGKVVFDGTEKWEYNTGVDCSTYSPFYTRVSNKKVGSENNFISDRFMVKTSLFAECEATWGEETNTVIYIKILNSKLSSLNTAGFKQWLSQNPTTVYYELETPTITPVEPIEFEVKPLANMTINSEIAPVSKHKVVLNRAGQIEQGIVQIAELKKRVDTLETTYDSYLLETQHKLSLLGFEYELESEEI